jgi:hypothetical protein
LKGCYRIFLLLSYYALKIPLLHFFSAMEQVPCKIMKPLLFLVAWYLT